MNVEQTLVSYNGTSTSTYVPTATTCVPGTVQCTTDYGANPTGTAGRAGFTGMFNAAGGITNGIDNGTPQYWTFVIDPRAHFYDAGNATGWPVYPTDVAYSIVRTVGYSDLPFVARTPGWIMAQSILPNGSRSFDVYGSGPSAVADHDPFNNTPYATMTSMLINDSTFCPSSAMSTMGNGCITFVANGSGALWPEFLDFVVDNLGASIESCGWDSHNGAAIPGFVATSNPHGDGPCTLAGGATSTSAPAFLSYLASVAPGTGTQAAGTGMYSWDKWQNESFAYPADVPGIQSTDIGSGPYYSSVGLSTVYGLKVNPAYEQPSACGGDLSYAQYTGYCDPAPGTYVANISVDWTATGSTIVAGFNSGQLDFGSFPGAAEVEPLQSSGKVVLVQARTGLELSQNYVTDWNNTTRAADGFGGANNVPADFFSYEAARGLMQMAYPFATIQKDVWTVDGLPMLLPGGGPIPDGTGCYYAPTTTNGCTNNYTVPWPFEANGGVPSPNSSQPGTAGWWWSQGRNVSSPYYDPELGACTPITPCQFSIEGGNGAPSQDAANDLWATSIESITGGAVRPNTPDISESDLLTDCGLASPGQNACPIYDSGWVSDFGDPSDMEAAYGLPNGTFPAADAVPQQFSLPRFDNVTACAHDGDSMQNLTYWANVSNSTAIPTDCQGVAYGVFGWATALADSSSSRGQRLLLYDLGQTILNALDLYTWIGDGVGYSLIAPWIAPSSVNVNPLLGAEGEQFWFQLRYGPGATPTVPVEFKAVGVSKGGTFSVTVGSNTLTAVAPAPIVFNLAPNATFTWSASSPDFYVAAPHTGSGTTPAYSPTKQKTLVVVVHYRNYGATLKFIESGLNAKSNSWGAVVNGTFALIATNVTSVSIRLGNGTYPWIAVVPAGYELSATTGSVTLTAPHTTVVHLEYTPYNHYGVTFMEGGLPGGASWSVSLKLEKGTGSLAPSPGSEQSTATSIDWTDLANGTYVYQARSAGHPTVTGTIVIEGANAKPVTVTFTS